MSVMDPQPGPVGSKRPGRRLLLAGIVAVGLVASLAVALALQMAPRSARDAQPSPLVSSPSAVVSATACMATATSTPSPPPEGTEVPASPSEPEAGEGVLAASAPATPALAAGEQPASPSPSATASAPATPTGQVPTEVPPTPEPTRTASPVATAAPTASVPYFGLNMDHIDPAFGLDLAVQAGIGHVRQAGVYWSGVEPVRTEPPTYRWDALSSLEQELINAARAGLQVSLVVQYTPAWAQALPGHSCGPIRDDSLDEFAQFLTALVARYSRRPYGVHLWELFNEPDVDPSLVGPDSWFGCWGDAADEYYGGRTYARMLRVAYPAIKAADPKAQVILGGLLLDAPENPASNFLAGVLEGGGGDFFDILAFHAYVYFSAKAYDWEQVPTLPWTSRGGVIKGKTGFLREIMARYGYDKPLLLNEAGFGWYGKTEPPTGFRKAQADFVTKLSVRGRALNLAGFVWWGWKEPAWRHMELLWPDLSPRLGCYAMDFAHEMLEGSRYIGPTRYPGTEGYEFRRAGKVLQVVWSADGLEHPVSVVSRRAPRAFDSTGQPVTPTVSSGQVVYSVLRPIYLELEP